MRDGGTVHEHIYTSIWCIMRREAYPLGKLNSRSLDGPSMKLATLNQLTGLLPFSSFGPLLTPKENLEMSRPVDVGDSSGWSARRPIICIRASERGADVEKARTAEAARGSVRKACILLLGSQRRYDISKSKVEIMVM